MKTLNWYAKKQGYGKFSFYKPNQIDDEYEIEKLEEEGTKIFDSKEEALKECKRLANITPKEELKDYMPISTKLPNTYAILFKNNCIRLNQTISERVRNLIIKDLNEPSKTFLAGINKIKYNKVHNSFNWFVQLDTGQEFEVLNNVPLEFLKNFQKEIQEAIKERNEWVHQSKPDSVDIPRELLEVEDE